jgi:hypothetical protein
MPSRKAPTSTVAIALRPPCQLSALCIIADSRYDLPVMYEVLSRPRATQGELARYNEPGLDGKSITRPTLQSPLSNPSIRARLRAPFFLSIVFKLLLEGTDMVCSDLCVVSDLNRGGKSLHAEDDCKRKGI